MNNPFDLLFDKLTNIENILLDQRNTTSTAPNPITAHDYLTREQACKRLGGISLPTLAEYTKTGVLHGKRIGRRVLYSPADIDAALTAIKTTTNAGGVTA